MCGICGYFDPMLQAEGLDNALLKDMCEQITHRGPASGVFHIEELGYDYIGDEV